MVRLIKIPWDGQPLVDVQVDSLEFPHLNAATLGSEDANVEFVKARGLQALSAEIGETAMLSLIVDEDGLAKHLPVNMRASYLYGTHVHGHPVVGNAYLVLERLVEIDGEPDIELEGLPDEITPQRLVVAIAAARMAGASMFEVQDLPEPEGDESTTAENSSDD